MGFRVLGGGFQGLDSRPWDLGFTRFRFAAGCGWVASWAYAFQS